VEYAGGWFFVIDACHCDKMWTCWASSDVFGCLAFFGVFGVFGGLEVDGLTVVCVEVDG
jgi:hypothetical protein